MDQSAPVNVAVGRASPGALLELLKPSHGFLHVGVPMRLDVGWPQLQHHNMVTVAGVALTGPLVCGASQVVNDGMTATLMRSMNPIAHPSGQYPATPHCGSQ